MWRFLLLLTGWLGASFGAQAQVHLLLSEDSAPYQEVVEAFRAGVTGHTVQAWPLSEISPETVRGMSREADLLVPVGVRATRLVAEQYSGKAGVLALMLPRATAERLRWPTNLPSSRVGGLVLDPPPAQFMGLISEGLPGRERVGLLVSRGGGIAVPALEAEASRRGLRLHAVFVETTEEVGATLRRLLPEVDVLLLWPDAVTLNANNLLNVMQAAYRQRVPVVGFSVAQLRAGAALVRYASPQQIGRQGARVATRWLAEGGDLSLLSQAEFTLGINRPVLRSLDLTAPDEESLRRRLEGR